MSQYARYRRQPRQSTKALTAKLVLLAVIGTLLIGGLIAAQMAAGNDPSLGPKSAARTKKASTSTSSSSSADSGTDPNTTSGSSAGSGDYSSGTSGSSSGSSGSSSGYGYSTQQSSPAPVTSSTS
jgi:cytoskeletal protein RodZ